MDFAQVRTIVEKEYDYLADISCIKIYIGFSPGNSPGERLFDLLKSQIEKKGIAAQVIKTGSFGCCDFEPIVVVDIPGSSVILCLNADPEMAMEIEAGDFTAGMAKGNHAWFLVSGENKENILDISNMSLFRMQNRILLRNCGWIDPGNIGHYILQGNGFAGLSRVLQKNRQELMASFSTLSLEEYVHPGSSSMDQWKECLESESRDRYLVCNAVASDPSGSGTRLLLESDPHSILEGMLIGAYAVGASNCIIYVRAGSLAVSSLRALLDMMKKYNLVGSKILDSSFSAQIEIRDVPVDFSLGQEFESLRCMGLNRTSPHIMPTYPPTENLLSNTGIITNAELMAYLPSVFLADEELQTGFGFNRASETKIISLSGSIVHATTAEVPCGVSIRSTVEDIGGGVAGGKTIKALQVGLPAGVLIDPAAMDECIHCRTSGGTGPDTENVDVIDSDADIVELARARMKTVNEQSCGKCLFCSEGSRQMFNTLENLTDSKGKHTDLDFLRELGAEMKTGCLCAFGRSAPDLVLSSIELFRDEYEERIEPASRNVQTS